VLVLFYVVIIVVTVNVWSAESSSAPDQRGCLVMVD